MLVLLLISTSSSGQEKCLIEYSKLLGEACSWLITEVKESVEQAITSENLQVNQYFDNIKTAYESNQTRRSKYIVYRQLKT